MSTTWDRLKYLMKHEKDTKLFKLLTEKRKSFSELQKESKIKYDASLTRILRRLCGNGLVYHTYVERSEISSNPSNFYSLYEMTPVGKEILKLYGEMQAIAKEYDVKIKALADMPVDES